jgi:hypothetical protein
MSSQVDREPAAALARLRAERAQLAAAHRRARLAAAQYQEEERLANADRFARRLLGNLGRFGRRRTQPHYEALLARESEPVRFGPRSRERRDAA